MLLGHHIEKMAAISIFLWIYRLSQKSWYATMPNNPAIFETSLHIYRSSGRLGGYLECEHCSIYMYHWMWRHVWAISFQFAKNPKAFEQKFAKKGSIQK